MQLGILTILALLLSGLAGHIEQKPSAKEKSWHFPWSDRSSNGNIYTPKNPNLSLPTTEKSTTSKSQPKTDNSSTDKEFKHPSRRGGQ